MVSPVGIYYPPELVVLVDGIHDTVGHLVQKPPPSICYGRQIINSRVHQGVQILQERDLHTIYAVDKHFEYCLAKLHSTPEYSQLEIKEATEEDQDQLNCAVDDDGTESKHDDWLDQVSLPGHHLPQLCLSSILKIKEVSQPLKQGSCVGEACQRLQEGSLSEPQVSQGGEAQIHLFYLHLLCLGQGEQHSQEEHLGTHLGNDVCCCVVQ